MLHQPFIRCFGTHGAFEQYHQKVRFRWQRTQARIAHLGNLAGQPCPPYGVMRPAVVDKGCVMQRGNRRCLPAACDVKRLADAVHCIDCGGGAIAPADSFRRQPVNLGECPRNDDVGLRLCKFEPPIVLVRVKIFGIGLIDHEHHIRR